MAGFRIGERFVAGLAVGAIIGGVAGYGARDVFASANPAHVATLPSSSPTIKPAISTAQAPIVTVELSPESGWTRYRSSKFPCQADFPNGWINKSHLYDDPVYFSDFFTGPDKSELGNKYFAADVRISAEPIKSWIQLEDYAKEVLDKLQRTNFSSPRNYKISGKDKVDGVDALVIEAGGSDRNTPGRNFRDIIWVVVKDGQGWKLSTSFTPDYPAEADTVKKIIAKFKFINIKK